jgi:hypothetical protein
MEAVQIILAMIVNLESYEERVELFEEIAAIWCLGCGKRQDTNRGRPCQCANDE